MRDHVPDPPRVLSLAVADPAEAKLPFTVFGTYLRSLAGAVPLLDIPATLEWKPGFKFGAWEGNLLVLLYKLALIVPLLQLFSLLLKRLFAEAPAPAAEGMKWTADGGIRQAASADQDRMGACHPSRMMNLTKRLPRVRFSCERGPSGAPMEALSKH